MAGFSMSPRALQDHLLLLYAHHGVKRCPHPLSATSVGKSLAYYGGGLWGQVTLSSDHFKEWGSLLLILSDLCSLPADRTVISSCVSLESHCEFYSQPVLGPSGVGQKERATEDSPLPWVDMFQRIRELIGTLLSLSVVPTACKEQQKKG